MQSEMDTKKLRQKVLDLAIHGKLVKQDPNDEPASVLLDRIRAEKVRLVKEGKIKKSDLIEKPISVDEIPFEVPEGWVWTRFGTIANCILGKMLDKAKNDGFNKPYLRNINIRWGSVDFSDILSMPFTQDEEKKLTLVENDLLICEGGEPGRCAVWKKDYPSILFQKALHRARFYLNINPYFVASILKLYSNTNKLSPYITGSTIKHLPGVGLSLVPIPLPPLAEQHRIVKAVEVLFEQIDIIERSEKELEEAAKKTWNKLLNLAIQGHLVPQDPNEEPASVLLERIRAEKARLVKEGKLKKKDIEEKPISSDEIPFDIPEGWEWCRMNFVIYLTSGQDLVPSRYSVVENGIPYITGASNFINGGLLINRYTTSPTSISHLGDLLITCKGTVGKMAYNTIGDVHIARQIMSISSQYVYLPFIQ